MILAVPRSLPVSAEAEAYRLTAAELAYAHAPRVSLALFADAPFLLLKEGNDTRSRAEQLCAQAGFSPHIRLQLDQQLAAYNLAGYGLSAAFISDTLALSAPPDERLVYYRIDSPHVERSIRLFYKCTRVLTAPIRALLDILAKPKTDRPGADEHPHRRDGFAAKKGTPLRNRVNRNGAASSSGPASLIE